MASSSALREERRAALLMLQRLLLRAEASLSAGDADASEAGLKQAARAFALFRAREDEEAEAANAASMEERRRVLVEVARLLTDMDESISMGEAKKVKAIVGKVKKALDVLHVLDEAAHASGVRRRSPPRGSR